MDLDLRTETFTPGEDQSWLGSAHGTESTESITLDASAFIGTFTDGIIPSGVVLGKITATGLYGPHDSDNADGTEVAVGLLFTTIDTKEGDVDSPAALFTHGKVKVDNLPTDHGLDVAAAAQMEHIRFIGTVPADEV